MNHTRQPIDCEGPTLIELEAAVAVLTARIASADRKNDLILQFITELAKIMTAEFDALSTAVAAAVSSETAAAAKVRELTAANAALVAENDALKAGQDDPAQLQALADSLTAPTDDLNAAVSG